MLGDESSGKIADLTPPSALAGRLSRGCRLVA
jgi:hypothetical protein